jgi:hypothetical protein
MPGYRQVIHLVVLRNKFLNSILTEEVLTQSNGSAQCLYRLRFCGKHECYFICRSTITGTSITDALMNHMEALFNLKHFTNLGYEAP